MELFSRVSALLSFALVILLSFESVQAQVGIDQYGQGVVQPALPLSTIHERAIAQLDLARTVEALSASPDGAHWMIIDRFGVLRSIVIDGVRAPREFNEIPPQTARFSPEGDYAIWLGLERHYTEKGFDSTVVFVYRNLAPVGAFVADYPQLEFSRTGKSWGVTLPFANVYQSGDRDLVLVNNLVVSRGFGRPRDLSFDHAETHWMYRATEAKREYLISAEEQLPYTSTNSAAKRGQLLDSAVYRLTPDVAFNAAILEGRDYDNGFEHVAYLRRTSFRPDAQDTAHAFIEFNGKHGSLYRWIQNVEIDSAGKHIAYFACDPSVDTATTKDERRAIVVHDSKKIAGPFASAGRLFLSPSGKHVLFSTGIDAGNTYRDGTLLDHVTQAQDCAWSQDESRVAYSATGTHGKVFVVVHGKRSAEFERIGSLGWLPNGSAVEYIALLNGKLLHVRQSY